MSAIHSKRQSWTFGVSKGLSNMRSIWVFPFMVGRAKRETFSEIKHKVWLKLQNWKEKLLSQCGKEILIKAVALAILTFSMSYFKILETLCHKLE